MKQRNPWNPIASIADNAIWTIPLGLLMAGVTAFGLLVNYTPEYRATSVLVANHDYILSANVTPVLHNLVKSEQTLLINPMVLDPVLNEPGIRSAPSLSDPATAEKNLIANLIVTDGGTDSTMAISYEDTDPEAAAMVCNAIVESYLRQRMVFDSKRKNQMERLLEPEIQRWELEVAQHQRNVETLKKNLGLPGNDRATSAARNEALLTRYDNVSMELEILNRQISLLKEKRKDDDLNGADASESSLDPDDSSTNQRDEMVRQRDLLAIEEQVLKDRIADEKRRQESVSGGSAELIFAKDELQIASEVLTRLRSRIAEIRTESPNTDRVRLLAPAVTPRIPHNSIPYFRMSMWALGAFLVPLVLGYLAGFRNSAADQRGSSEDDDSLGES